MSGSFVTHEIRDLGCIRMHLARTGDGPPVVLLHGFPDLWYGWRHQIDVLAGAGFSVVAPDLRGYGDSDAPHGIDAYAMTELVSDVVALLESLGSEAVVVGHDWGGVIGWFLAMERPDLVSKLVVLNAPHPAAYRRELRRNPRQMLRSWYAMLFQLPLVPELLLRAFGLRLLRSAWRTGPAQSDDDRNVYLRAFSRKGRIRAALNYYRAAARRRQPKVRRIQTSTLIVWGARDPYLGIELTEGLDDLVPDLRIEIFEKGGHWLHLKEATPVNAVLLDFLRIIP